MTKKEKSAMLERVCDIDINEINEARMTIANGRKQLNYKDGSGRLAYRLVLWLSAFFFSEVRPNEWLSGGG